MTIKLSSIPTIALPAAALAITLLASGAGAETPRPDTRNCELSADGGLISVSARCGTLDVPENRAEPDGRQIELAWAIVEARAASPEPDPVFFLAGGPGQSARDTAPIVARALKDINRTRDLVFLDQRGTGGSNPLDCPFDEELLLTEPDLDAISDRLRECLAVLDADVRHYTTIDAAGDLDALRRHLGLEKINLVGGSYGTRLAQVYLRRHPESVRSVIIDGVVPMRLKLGSEHAMMLDRAIEKLLARCTGDAECRETFPGLEPAFAELKQRFRESPLDITVTHPRTGIAEEIEFTDAVLASSLRFLAYSPTTQMMIPYLIHEAATTGSPERLASQALMTSAQISDEIAIGLNFAVGCSEDWPYWPADADAAGTLLGNSFTELYAKICAWWPAEPVGPDFHDPFSSDVPMLILSGELDPVTPPPYGDEAAKYYSNSVHLVSAGRGHITITNPCIAGIATEFVAEASVAGLDTECMDTIGPEPFFTSLLGPSP
ncbi:MAG: alpha/beta fold hydrolase [Wenzhouxiangellaceae bacterium]|nr:alpha/beta fold hydrolase [Wenzhouxiangellaceae bacterium]